MRNMFFKEPESEEGYSIDNFKLELIYECQELKSVYLRLVVRIITHSEYKRIKASVNEDESSLYINSQDYSDISSEQENIDLSLVDDKKYIGVRLLDICGAQNSKIIVEDLIP